MIAYLTTCKETGNLKVVHSLKVEDQTPNYTSTLRRLYNFIYRSHYNTYAVMNGRQSLGNDYRIRPFIHGKEYKIVDSSIKMSSNTTGISLTLKELE